MRRDAALFQEVLSSFALRQSEDRVFAVPGVVRKRDNRKLISTFGIKQSDI
jgi:hypothetical protein